jgi:hypothetical protein
VNGRYRPGGSSGWPLRGVPLLITRLLIYTPYSTVPGNYLLSTFLANCGNPTDKISAPNVIVIYNEESTNEGSRANISCHFEYELIGLYSTECMSNGEWVPDPQEFEINCSS